MPMTYEALVYNYPECYLKSLDILTTICVLFIGLFISSLGVWLIFHDLKTEGAICLFISTIMLFQVLYGFLVIFSNSLL